jgi:hypothetical protein
MFGMLSNGGRPRPAGPDLARRFLGGLRLVRLFECWMPDTRLFC